MSLLLEGIVRALITNDTVNSGQPQIGPLWEKRGKENSRQYRNTSQAAANYPSGGWAIRAGKQRGRWVSVKQLTSPLESNKEEFVPIVTRYWSALSVLVSHSATFLLTVLSDFLCVPATHSHTHAFCSAAFAIGSTLSIRLPKSHCNYKEIP